MKYFIDTEFLEGKQDKTIFGIKYGETKPTIDLISIGIVAEDDREYYAISKDFNLKEAWNRHDIKRVMNSGDMRNHINYSDIKVYWIRDNVLLPIYYELCLKENKNMIFEYSNFNNFLADIKIANRYKVIYKNFKRLIKKYGKSNKQIAEEIKEFCLPSHGFIRDWYENKNGKFDLKWNFEKLNNYEKEFDELYLKYQNPKFYVYYGDYDWVVFCWIFGKMINLPKSFPYYVKDLKQELDNYIDKTWKDVELSTWGHEGITLEKLKTYSNYPKQNNEHNALNDAKWNKKLYLFLKTIEKE